MVSDEWELRTLLNPEIPGLGIYNRGEGSEVVQPGREEGEGRTAGEEKAAALQQRMMADVEELEDALEEFIAADESTVWFSNKIMGRILPSEFVLGSLGGRVGGGCGLSGWGSCVGGV